MSNDTKVCAQCKQPLWGAWFTRWNLNFCSIECEKEHGDPSAPQPQNDAPNMVCGHCERVLRLRPGTKIWEHVDNGSIFCDPADGFVKMAFVKASPAVPPLKENEAPGAAVEAAPSLPQQGYTHIVRAVLMEFPRAACYEYSSMFPNRGRQFGIIDRARIVNPELSELCDSEEAAWHNALNKISPASVPEAPSAQKDEPRRIHCGQDNLHHYGGGGCIQFGFGQKFTPSPTPQPVSDEQRVLAAYANDLDAIHTDGWGDRTWEDNRKLNPRVVAYEQSLAAGKETK